MSDTAKKYCFFFFVIILLSACKKSSIDEAVPGKVYSHKTDEIKLLSNNKKSFSVYATYKWSICNNVAFREEIKYYGKKSLDLRTEIELMNTMRVVATTIEDTNVFFSDAAAMKIKKIVSKNINEKGLCVAKLKIYPYNKSLQSTAESGD